MTVPGFGHSSFGAGPFGRHDWARTVFYDQYPETYKVYDADNNFLLERYSTARGQVFDLFRQKIQELPGLRDPITLRTQYNEVRFLRLGRVRDLRTAVLQRGLDATIVVSGTVTVLTSPTARFYASSIGKEILIYNSAAPFNNNRPFIVSSVYNVNSVTLVPTPILDAEPSSWELRGYEEGIDFVRVEVTEGDAGALAPGWELTDGKGIFKVKAKRRFRTQDREARLLTERETEDAQVSTQGLISSAAVLFDEIDIGKTITLANSGIGSNNGSFSIEHVVSATEAYTSYFLIRGVNSNGGVAYSSRGRDFGPSVLPRIRHVAQGIFSPLTISVSGPDVTVFVATTGAGTPDSTATDVSVAINAHAEANLIFFAQATGSGAGLVSENETFVEVFGGLLTYDPGPLALAILPKPELDLEGLKIPLGAVEQYGQNLDVTVSGSPVSTIYTPSALFTALDVGKRLMIRGSSSGNNGQFRVSSRIDDKTLEVEATLTVELGSNLFWELRASTSIGDLGEVSANPQPLLPFLATDFGISVDRQEKESRQRSTVQDVVKWADLKGHADSYRIIGAISGFDVNVQQLYHLSQDLYLSLPFPTAATQCEVADTTVGKYGSTGSLTKPALNTRLFDPSASFTYGDIGSSVRVVDSADPLNEKFYQIESFVETSAPYRTAQFRLADQLNTPDFSGVVMWQLVRFYGTLPATQLAYDEFDADRFEQYIYGPVDPPALVDFITNGFVPTAVFGIDRFCWEPDLYLKLHVGITTVTNLLNGYFEITVSTSGYLPISASPYSGFPIAPVDEIINPLGTLVDTPPIGVWKLTDSAGFETFLHTSPREVVANVSAKFLIFSTVGPALGDAFIEYVCHTDEYGCDYCASNRALATVTLGDISTETGAAVEGLMDRLFDKLEQATPAHVQLVYKVQQNLQASFTFQAWTGP